VPFCECVAAGVLCSLVVVGILSGMSVVCLRIGLTGPRWGRGLLGGTALGVDVTLSSWRIVGLVAECVCDVVVSWHESRLVSLLSHLFCEIYSLCF